MTRRRLIGLVLAAVLLATLAVGFVLLAPVQLGGRTAYVITHGTSMEPTFTGGDLVLTRTRSDYGVGDVVLYHSEQLDRDVLHRVVALDGDRLVLQGDNNSYRDPDHPTLDQVRGAAWVVIPGAGRPLEWLQQPLVLAVIAFLVVLGLLAGGREVSRRRAPSEPEPLHVSSVRPVPSVAHARTALTGAVAALVLFALLAVVAFGQPASHSVEREGAWHHSGTFAYEAVVPRSAVYPRGEVSTGDAVFTSIVRKLDVTFDYTFGSREPADVRGGIRLDAVIANDQGWTRAVPIRGEQPLEEGRARVTGVLDVRAVTAIVERMKQLTGSTATVFTVSITPVAEVAGVAGTALVNETFRPTLELQLDGVSMHPAPSDDAGTPSYDVEQLGSGSATVPASIGLGVTSIAVDRARSLSLLGLAVAFLAAVGAGTLVVRHMAGSEAGRIQARFGSRLVDAEIDVPEGRWITDVGSIDELARVADHYDRVILRGARAGSDEYYVDDGVALYRYRGVPTRGRAPGSALPARDA